MNHQLVQTKKSSGWGGTNLNNPSKTNATGPNGGSNVATGASESIIADEDGQTLGTLLK